MKLAVYIRTSSESSDRLSRCSDGWFYTETITTETKVFIDTKDISYNDASVITDYLKDNPIRDEHEKWKDQSNPCEKMEYNASESNELCQKFKRQDVVAEEFDLGNKETYYDAAVVSNERIQQYRLIQQQFVAGVKSFEIRRMIDMVDSGLIDVNLPFDTFLIATPLLTTKGYVSKPTPNLSRGDVEVRCMTNICPLDLAVMLQSSELAYHLLGKGAINSNNYNELLNLLLGWHPFKCVSQSSGLEKFDTLSGDETKKKAIAKIYNLYRLSDQSNRFSLFDKNEVLRVLMEAKRRDGNNRLIDLALRAKSALNKQLIALLSMDNIRNMSQGALSVKLKHNLLNLGLYYILCTQPPLPLLVNANIHKFNLERETIVGVAWAIKSIITDVENGNFNENNDSLLKSLTADDLLYYTNEIVDSNENYA